MRRWRTEGRCAAESEDQLSAQSLAAFRRQNPPTPPSRRRGAAAPAEARRRRRSRGKLGSDAIRRRSFSLEIAKDGTYYWRHTLEGKSQNLSGGYTVADNLLILKEGGNPAMIGQIVAVDANRFTFKLAGNNPADPGLAFARNSGRGTAPFRIDNGTAP